MSQLKLFNTMSRSVEEFIPLMDDWKKDFVWIYTCWPTVYSDPHIWNLRAYIFASILWNTIRNILWYPLKHVVNITDVWHLVWDWDDGQDKMEKWSYIDNITVWDVADKYINLFHKYLRMLNINFDYFPRATDYINEQIEIVKILEQNWLTYEIEWDWVYFDTSKIDDYWKLLWPNYKKHLDWLRAWARVDVEWKKNHTDFALRKFSPTSQKRQMEWDSPWCIWFPWWHLECSAMSRKFLWDNFDIHTWGIDHIPTHHSWEIAQSENSFCSSIPWVKYWLHNEFLNLDWQKISKSLWNTFTANDIIIRKFSMLDFKYMILNTHYRKEVIFTWEVLNSFKSARQNLVIKLSEIFRSEEDLLSKIDFTSYKDYEDFVKKEISSSNWEDIFSDILSSLLDDLNTVEMIWKINKYLSTVKWESEKIDLIKTILYFDENLFRLDLYKEIIFHLNKEDIEIPEEVENLAKERFEARKNKDFEKADELREKISEMWYEVKDTKEWYEII